MVEIKSQKTVSDIVNSNEVLTLSGSIDVQAAQVVRASFYIKSVDNTKTANYNISVDSQGRISENLSGDREIYNDARALANQTITEFETMINK